MFSTFLTTKDEWKEISLQLTSHLKYHFNIEAFISWSPLRNLDPLSINSDRKLIIHDARRHGSSYSVLQQRGLRPLGITSSSNETARFLYPVEHSWFLKYRQHGYRYLCNTSVFGEWIRFFCACGMPNVAQTSGEIHLWLFAEGVVLFLTIIFKMKFKSVQSCHFFPL